MTCKINEYISKLEKSLPDIHDRLNGKVTPVKQETPKKESQTKPTELKWLKGRNIIVGLNGSPKVQVDTLEDLISLADEFHKMMIDRHAPDSKNYTKHIKWFKEIFSDLDKKGIKFQPVEVEFTDKVQNDFLGWQEYSSGKQKIKLNTNKLTPAYPLKVVLHEYAHAITLSKLNQYPVLKKKTKVLMDRAKKELKGIDTNPNTVYAFTDEKEFLAEVISNPQLQTELNKLDSTDTGYVAQVKKIFKALLAKITKKDATALTDALNIVVELNNQTDGNTAESPTIEAYYKDETDTMTLRERKKYEEQMANKAVKEGC